MSAWTRIESLEQLVAVGEASIEESLEQLRPQLIEWLPNISDDHVEGCLARVEVLMLRRLMATVASVGQQMAATGAERDPLPQEDE